DTQSNEAHAGTTPRVGSQPRVGFRPTTPQNIAGTRPEPAVSVPSAASIAPDATAAADPLDDPPATRPGATGLSTTPYGLRVPTRPVANWSRAVLPTTTAPCSTRRVTTGAEVSG